MARVQAMAMSMLSVAQNVLIRRRYKNVIEGHLTGSFADLISSELASLNGQKKLARYHRRRAVNQIDNELPGWLLHPVQGFDDRQKVALEALNKLRSEEKHNRRVAELFLKKWCGLQTVRRLPKSAAGAFFSWVTCVIEDAFLSEKLLQAKTANRRKP